MTDWKLRARVLIRILFMNPVSFFNDIKNLSKKRDSDSILDLIDLYQLIMKNEKNKNEINENNIDLVVTSLKYYIFERKPINSRMEWEIKLVTTLLETPQLKSHLKNYLGVDVTDDEMADSVFAKPRRLIR
jgi:hypothetical protein